MGWREHKRRVRNSVDDSQTPKRSTLFTNAAVRAIICGVTVPDNEARAIDSLTDRLRAQFPDAPADAVRAAVVAAYQEFTGKPIRDFVPIFAERTARKRLVTAEATS